MKRSEAVEEAVSQEEAKPKWRIGTEAGLLITLGVALVSVFSDPMCDVLSRLTDERFTGENG